MRLITRLCFLMIILGELAAIAADIFDLDITNKADVYEFDTQLMTLNKKNPLAAQAEYARLVKFLRSCEESVLITALNELWKSTWSETDDSSVSCLLSENGTTTVAIELILQYVYKNTRGFSYANFINNLNAHSPDINLHASVETISFEALTNLIALSEHVLLTSVTSINLSPYSIQILPVTILQLASLKTIYVAESTGLISLKSFAPTYKGYIPPQWQPNIRVLNGGSLSDGSDSTKSEDTENLPAVSSNNIDMTLKKPIHQEENDHDEINKHRSKANKAPHKTKNKRGCTVS